MDLSNKRFDYFLIWGNGLIFKTEILNYLRKQQDIQIIRIQHHKPKSIRKLVKVIYSYDYAPFQHLRDKTRYLLKTPSDVCFIFILNKKPEERIFGEGEFRHIECVKIKHIKENLRNIYNPRINGKRTEEHVIHATDNEMQVDYILKYLGYNQGIELLKNNPNPLLNLPYYIPKFSEFIVKSIDLSHIYCNIIKGDFNKYWTVSQSIEESPHYQCLNGDSNKYEQYVISFLGGPLKSDYSLHNFLDLSERLNYLEEPFTNNYILVTEFRPKQYLIQDGVHRAAILKHKGFEKIPVAVI